MADKKSIIEFPCNFPIKIIGKNTLDFSREIMEITKKHFPDSPDEAILSKKSQHGNYLSITITVYVHDQKTLRIARWPGLTTPWLSMSLREKSSIPALSEDCIEDALAAMETIQIDGPAEKSTLARAPNSIQAVSAEFRALGTQQKVMWLVNGQWVADTQANQLFVMKFDTPGWQRITALTDAGAWDEMSLFVLK